MKHQGILRFIPDTSKTFYCMFLSKTTFLLYNDSSITFHSIYLCLYKNKPVTSQLCVFVLKNTNFDVVSCCIKPLPVAILMTVLTSVEVMMRYTPSRGYNNDSTHIS